MKKILILHIIKEFEKYNRIKYDFFSDSSSLLIAVSIKLRIFLKNNNIQYTTLEEYISDKNADEIDYAAFDLAENWHRDLFNFKEISLGRLFQWDMKYYFARIIRILQVILNIIDKECPDKIITFKDNDFFIREFNEILNHICVLKKISINFLPFTNILKKTLKPKFSILDLIIKNSTIFLSLIPISKILKFFSDLLSSLRFLKLSRKNKDLNNILMVGGYTYPTLVDEISKNSIVFNLYGNRTLALIYKNVMKFSRRKKIWFYAYLEDYKTKKLKEQSISFIKGSLNEWKKIIKNPKFLEIFNFKGISLWPFIKNEITSLIFSEFRWAIENILAFDSFLKRHNIDLITFNVDTMKFQKTLVSVASKLNIPTLVIQHGLAGNRNQGNSKIYTIGFIPFAANKIAVWGRTAKEWLMHHGIAEERIIITGSPRFDKYIKMNQDKSLKQNIKNSIYQHFEIKKDKKLILFTPNNQGFNLRFTSLHLTLLETENIYRCVLNTMNNISNSHLIIKLHPNDPDEYISNMLIKNLGIKNVSVVRKYNLEHLLISCDCQITTWSTTGLEGLLFGNPLICIKFRNRKYDVPYIEYNVAYEVSKCEDLPSTIKKVLNNPDALKINYKKFIEDYTYKTDGLATKRVAKLVENLCKKNKELQFK